MKGRKNMFIDVDECTGCNLCIIACKDEHVGNRHEPWTGPQPDSGHFWMDVKAIERGSVPKVKVTYLPVLCQHCENAPCMKVCPEDAIARRDDGLIWINEERCTGCGLCQEACPYDVIYMNEESNVAQKCTGCAHLVDRGETPRCAEVCPRDAIYFADEDDPLMKDLKEKSEPLHPEFETKPLVFYKGLPKPFFAGTVVDYQSGEVVRGVSVTAVDLFNDKVTGCTTDEFGDYWLRGLEQGHRYSITMERAGYAKETMVFKAEGDRNNGETFLKRETG